MIKMHRTYVEELHEKYPEVDKKWLYYITKKYMRYMFKYVINEEGFYLQQRDWYLCFSAAYYHKERLNERMEELRVERALRKKLQKYV